MRSLLIVGLSAILVTMAGCRTATRTGEIALATAPCARSNVGFFQVPAELARLQTCGGVAVCTGNSVNFETKEVAGILSGTPFIWGIGSTSTSFTPAMQDAFLTDARARATAARPGSKSIVSISFFTDIVVSGPSSSGYIGAIVEYADCLFAQTPR
jgi:hypothetical protein